MSDKKPSHFGGWGSFKVSGEAATATEPCKGPFDDPAPGQELEAFDPERPFDNVDSPRPAMGECIDELFAAIHPIRKDMPEPGKAVSQALQQRDGAMDILNIGGVNMDSQEETIGIGDDVPLASVDALAGVKTAWATGLRRRSTLAIDDSRGRLGFTPEFAARLPNQDSNDPVPSAGVSPGIKITLDSRVRREVARQRSPLATGRQNIENRLHHLAQIDFPWSPKSPWRRHLSGNQRPLRIGQIACVAQPIALILDTSDFGPRHRALPRIFANPKEAQPAEITHSFFGQALRMRGVDFNTGNDPPCTDLRS